MIRSPSASSGCLSLGLRWLTEGGQDVWGWVGAVQGNLLFSEHFQAKRGQRSLAVSLMEVLFLIVSCLPSLRLVG